MRKANIKKILSFVLTFFMTVSISLSGVGNVMKVHADEQVILSEGFDNVTKNGTPVPAGWTFNGINSYYASDFGVKAPSIALKSNLNSITTPQFVLNGQGKLSFWVKGQPGTATCTSKLLIEKSDGTNWTTIKEIQLTADKGTEIFDLDSSTKQIRFTLEKLVGNVGIDDVTITQTGAPSTPIAVTGITLNPTTLSLEEEKTSTITATVQPDNASNKKVNWVSDKPTIATVTNGTVTAVSAGTADITATTEDGNKVATCVVTVTAKPAGDVTKPEITNLKPGSGEYTGLVVRPTISADYSDTSGVDLSSVVLKVDDVDVTSSSTKNPTGISYVPSNDLSIGLHKVSLKICDSVSPLNVNTTEWTFNVGVAQFNLYFGGLHSHTNFSDGTGTPDEAYTWARDNAKADFMAITDHSNWFDNEKDLLNESITDLSLSTSTKWQQLHQIADKYNQDGKFVAIAAYEMTWSGSTGGWGHINTFNTPWFASRSNSKMDLPAYYKKLAQSSSSISQLNHPGTTFGDFSDFGFYSPEADQVVDLVEVGNGEGLVRSSGYFPSYNYYTRALDKGWHLAPTNNQDNHKGNWISANTARTVIVAPSLTRDSLYDAMRNRRVYATEDENLRINYSVNNQPMGVILSNPTKLDATININDPDSTDVIGKVSIIVDGGKVLDSKNFTSNTAQWNLSFPTGYSYYYVRVDEGDKDIAVTAPVWASSVLPVGMSKVEASQNPQVINKPVDITSTVYNNGSQELKDVKVEFFKNTINASNKIGEGTIASIISSTSSTSKITWTPTEAGDFIIYAQATIKIDGEDKTFTQSTAIKVADPKDLIKVVLDAGHVNQYVSGDYAGKMLTLTSMLKDKEYMLVQNPDELTAEDLENAKVLIITDPQSKDVTGTYPLSKSNYTDKEVNVIKDFVAKGGSLIITSRADYNEKGATDPTYHSAAQGNSILQAIGSNLRFNDDEVVDDNSNGGQNYRLYFDKYTGSKYKLTTDIPDGETYSFYSGCSVVLKDGSSDANIDWLVKGHDTTYSIDSDLANDCTPIDKGKVNALAAEILPNGAKVIVAGSTFFSDFETASNDNAYSNKEITDNVISWLAVNAPLKTIAEVRADANHDGKPDNLGKTFAIEGTVTAQSEAVTPKNAFFEVIYVQDGTAGITVFGVSKTPLKVGEKVRLTGFVDEYQGDTELQIKNEDKDLTILDESIKPIAPKEMKTSESMLESSEGLLVKATGKVTKMDTQNIYIDDGSGVSRVYVEGYIGDGTEASKGKWNSSIKIGDTVSVVGLASEDPEGHRLRVRNTSEIVLMQNLVVNTTGDTAKDLEIIKEAIKNSNPQYKVIVNVTSPVISSEIFTALKGIDKNVSFVSESQGIELTWTFNGKDITNTSISLDLSLNASSPNATVLSKIDKNAQVLSFKYHGALPAPMKLTIKVDTNKFDITKPIYFYYYNEVTKKAELIGKGLTAYKNGDAYFVDVTIDHCSDYFLSAADNTIISANVAKLVQTGYMIDTNVLMGFGVLFIALGAVVFVVGRKNKKNSLTK